MYLAILLSCSPSIEFRSLIPFATLVAEEMVDSDDLIDALFERMPPGIRKAFTARQRSALGKAARDLRKPAEMSAGGEDDAGAILADIFASAEPNQPGPLSARRLRSITDQIPARIYYVDRDQRLQYANDRFAAYFGRSTASMVGVPLREIVGEEAYADIRCYIAKALDGNPTTFAETTVDPDGTKRILQRTYEPDRARNGDVVGYFAHVVDVTDRERTITEKTALFETVLEHIDQGISVMDGDLNVRLLSDKAMEILELPAELNRPGTNIADFFRYNAERGEYGDGDIDQLVDARIELAKRFVPHRFERARPDGRILEIRGTPISGGGFVTTYTDITDRKRAELALAESEEKFRNLFELANDSIFVLDPDSGRILDANENAAQQLGYSRDELLELRASDIVPPNCAARAIGDIRDQATQNRTFESVHRCKDGTEVPVEVCSRSIEYGGQRVIQSIARDITERKRFEQTLVENAREL